MHPAFRKLILVSVTLTSGIAGNEGLKLVDYKDPVGVVTACSGHTATAQLGKKRTREECDAITKKDMESFAIGVQKAVTVELNQNQFDALVDFAYNVGLGAFGKSTLLKKLNAGDYAGASKEFARWDKAGGVNCRIRRDICGGIITRRDWELELFNRPIVQEPTPYVAPQIQSFAARCWAALCGLLVRPPLVPDQSPQ